MEFIGRLWLVSALVEMTGVGGILDTVKVHLFKNDVEVGPDTLVANLVEADYTGYAASAALVWNDPFLNANGNGEVTAPSIQFQPTGTTVTNDIYGFWLMPTVASTTPVLAVRFSEPVPMTGPLDALSIDPRFVFSQIG